MTFPLLLLTFCALLPDAPEADLRPVLAPAILVAEGSLAVDTLSTADLGELADVAPPRVQESTEGKPVLDLGPALVVESTN
jgi:hypothetical protein